MGKPKADDVIFNVYSANLTICFPDVKDTFLCPFCKTPFGREALTSDPKRIIRAHCIPKALKGKLTTLACNTCDNEAGSDIDAQLANRLEAEDFFQGESKKVHRIDAEVAGHRTDADFWITRDEHGKPVHHVRLHEFDKRSPKEQARLAIQAACESGEAFKHTPVAHVGGRLNIDMNRARVSLLRCAYLMMFRHFGYSYILNDNLERLREQFRRPDDEIIPGNPVIRLTKTEIPMNTVAIIKSPQELQAFFVPMQFRTKSGREVCMGIFMPGLGKDGDSIYERALESQARITRVDFDCRFISYEAGRLGQVFCDTAGNFLRRSNVARRSFKPLLQRAGLPVIRFHDLRHTAASLLLLLGENPKVVQERLGHSRVEVTMNVYSHVLPTMQQEAARKLDRLLG